MMNATEVNEGGFRGTFHELQTECRAVTEMAKGSTTLQEQLMKSGWELPTTKRESMVVNAAVLELQCSALSMMEKIRSCRQ